jgi:hypothetical protein
VCVCTRCCACAWACVIVYVSWSVCVCTHYCACAWACVCAYVCILQASSTFAVRRTQHIRTRHDPHALTSPHANDQLYHLCKIGHVRLARTIYMQCKRVHTVFLAEISANTWSYTARICIYIYIYIRDGSYGLLRRPIRYNTLLIRNTRIIRERIFAILGGTLGLHQPPSNHHELSPQPPEHYNASW